MLPLALRHPASTALCSRECSLYASVLLIFLNVWEGFSCLLPNTWQGNEAFALGNIEIPRSLTLGAFVAIHNTSEWWTGSSALPGSIPLASKCAFCWYPRLLSFPWLFCTKVGCHRAPRVITVTGEQKLGCATRSPNHVFIIGRMLFFGDVINLPFDMLHLLWIHTGRKTLVFLLSLTTLQQGL